MEHSAWRKVILNFKQFSYFVTTQLFERNFCRFSFYVIPVKTGIQGQEDEIWIPASAGMTSFFHRIILRFFKEL